MDKQTTDTLKIKINGLERPLTKENENTEEIPFTSWDEKLKAETEVASAKQPIEKEDEFPWLLPDEEEEIYLEDPKVITPSKKKKQLSNQTITPYHYPTKSNRKKYDVAFPVKRIMTILLLAIGVGIMFGYIALNFLSNDDMPTASTPSEVINENQANIENSEGVNDEKEAGTNAGVSTSSTATLQLYAVQGGIFSTKAGAETVASDIKAKGFASAVMEIDGSFTVFAGLGKEKAQTSALNEQYKQKDFADFWGGKQLSSPISTSSSAAQWASSIQELSSLSSLTANGNRVSEDEITKAESAIKEIKTSDETEKKFLEKLLLAADNVKNNQGWEAQQNLLDVMSGISSK